MTDYLDRLETARMEFTRRLRELCREMDVTIYVEEETAYGDVCSFTGPVDESGYSWRCEIDGMLLDEPEGGEQ